MVPASFGFNAKPGQALYTKGRSDTTHTMQSNSCMLFLDLLSEATAELPPPLPGQDHHDGRGDYEDEPVLTTLGRAIVHDIPDHALVCAMQTLELLSKMGDVKVGSICSGSDMGHNAIVALLQAYPGHMPSVRHTMCVEWIAWKRDWILEHHCPDTLFSDVKDFANTSAFDYVSSTEQQHPAVDIVTIGFSCKCFSTLNNRAKEFDRAVLEGKGSSGETATCSLLYVQQHKPKIVLLENVIGLLKGYTRKNPITNQLVIDFCSNLAVLLDALRDMGYVCPFARVNPAPRMAANRARAWLPCVYRPDLGEAGNGLALLEATGRDLLTLLTTDCEKCIPMTRIKMDLDSKGFDFWHWKASSKQQLQQAASHEHQGYGHISSSNSSSSSTHHECRGSKWLVLHSRMFNKAGLTWPPILSDELSALASEAGLTNREAEILHYSDLVDPMEHCLEADMLIDLSQSIGRCRESTKAVPCITPRSRLWWRRDTRWLLAPEAMLAQGYDPTKGMRSFSHRQVLDLMGNAFNSSCLVASLATALTLSSLRHAGP
jgi:site-specific DNA-cytosine methylase